MIAIYYSHEVKGWIVFDTDTDQIFGICKTREAGKRLLKFVKSFSTI